MGRGHKRLGDGRGTNAMTRYTADVTAIVTIEVEFETVHSHAQHLDLAAQVAALDELGGYVQQLEVRNIQKQEEDES